MVEDFDGVVKLWKHAYEEMRLHPSELPLYLTESVNNPPEKRQKTLRYLFEELKVPSVSLCDTAYCHLRSAGRSTGVVVDCSYGLTSITPVIEGCSQRSASLTLDVGGYQLTAFMCNLLKSQGVDIPHAEAIKESMAKVAAKDKYESEVKSAMEISYMLDGGKKVMVGGERIECVEALFNPSLIFVDKVGGLHTLVANSILKVDEKHRAELLDNIIIVGGGSFIKGIEDRLADEVQALFPTSTVTVLTGTMFGGKNNAFIGAVGDSQMKVVTGQFTNFFITKEEYEKFGSAIIDKKCSTAWV